MANADQVMKRIEEMLEAEGMNITLHTG